MYLIKTLKVALGLYTKLPRALSHESFRGEKFLMIFFTAEYSGRRCQSESCRKVTGIFKRLKSTVERCPTKSDSSDSLVITGRLGFFISTTP